ncbi:MAG: Hpt domain-containing protein, partial [Selenomonadaceae bacterium]|nr:Hpt domain-containing protein [Selenomonadaceae bacterium]
METNQYMDMFLDESHEHLQSLNDGLLGLEDNAEDLSILNEIFRNAHTLKGMSATMGYNKIAELTHEMEDVLDMLRKEQLAVTGDIIDTLFKCIDSLEQMINNVANGDPEDLIDVSDLVAKLSAISRGEGAPAPKAEASTETPAAEVTTATPAEVSADVPVDLSDTEKSVISEAEKRGMHGIYLKVTLAESCLLKSARSYMVMNALEELGEVIRTIPAAEDLEQENFERSFEVILITASEEEQIHDAVVGISEIETAETQVIKFGGTSAPQPEVRAAPVVEQKSTAPATAPAPAPAPKPSAPANKPAAQSGGQSSATNAAQKKSHA